MAANTLGAGRWLTRMLTDSDDRSPQDAGDAHPPGAESAEPGGADGTDPFRAGEDGRPGLGWERRDELGLPAALWRTVIGVVFSPARTFARMRQTGGWAEPLAFAVLVGSVGVWIGELWQMVSRSMLASATGIAVAEVAADNARAVAFALMAPLLVAIFTAIGAAIAHALLHVFGGAPHPYETSLRVVAYSSAAQLFHVVPICGVFIAAIWATVVQIIGLREAQEVPTGRAAAAILVPVLLSCTCLLFMSILALMISAPMVGGLG